MMVYEEDGKKIIIISLVSRMIIYIIDEVFHFGERFLALYSVFLIKISVSQRHLGNTNSTSVLHSRPNTLYIA